MSFSQESDKSFNGGIIKYAAPVGGAVLGYAISRGLGAGTAAKVAATVVPAVASYPVASGISDSLERQRAEEDMDFYLNQLEVYREKVEEILEASARTE